MVAAHFLESKTERDEVLEMLQEQEDGNRNLHVSQIIDNLNCISDISLLHPELNESDANEEDINADLELVKRERDHLEAKLESGDISICQAESSYFSKIRSQLYSNFEEEWDITHSIAEINELQKENNTRILDLANEMESLITEKEHTKNPVNKQQIGQLLTEKLVEIENLEKAMQENADVLKEWMEAKRVNEENRHRIQGMFEAIQSSKKKDIIEMQIAMRKLKLEKADLHLQNLSIRKQVMVSKKQNESKDKKLKMLQQEIERMRKEMAMKDRELERSKQILSKKDEELKRIKNISVLTPKDINQMANEQSSIEVLQQISVNNQLSPSIYSPSNIHQKENKAILSHPFYKNLGPKYQENGPYAYQTSSNQAQKMASRRYDDIMQKTHDAAENKSFQSLSSITQKPDAQETKTHDLSEDHKST